ncbi:MAG TPA: type I-C CRISPR-associated protein Cas8c/Csd1 [Alicycliphilus sp.]|mgnify:CR=1 FL=1|nr:type I-C CRISPR-associated protein Cas8c/Csd1 [Alicycliphilus sp.]HRP19490.1 type I-C CRISPR-associated protein Cas8c/Csd1 [Alicycliphilus sp.]
MILQALHEYYDRCDDLPREGWIRRGVDYALVLNTQGDCVALNALGDKQKGKLIPAERLVTAIGKQAMKHTNSGKDANLLWDNASFVLGTGNKGDIKLASFIETIQTWLGELEDPGVQAVQRFCTGLQQQPNAVASLLERFGCTEDFEKRDPVLIFQLQGDIEGVHERQSVRHAFEAVFAGAASSGGVRGNCLVSGRVNVPIALNESVIKEVWGGQAAGCNIIAFNARSFESYGKHERQGENAPVSVQASFAYTTALNHLLRKGSPQRIQVGDASTVFWAEKQDPFETIFGDVFKDDPNQTEAVHALLSAIHSGKLAGPEGQTRFHVLGLAPNAARISVRFYHCLPLRDLGQRIAQHFTDLELVRGPNDSQYLSLKRLLQAVCLATSSQKYGDLERLPPILGGAIVDAVLDGENAPYPRLWLNAAVGRLRADHGIEPYVQQQRMYAQLAAIKACLNRQIRLHPREEKEFLPMLDPDNTHPAYRLGRLFAVLEKAQEEASPGLNATIRDRYYGAASSTPVAVFTTLLRLKNAHLKKLSPGRAQWFEKLLGEVLSPVADFPAHLALPDQGRFALGYYHQRQDFFTKKPAADNNPDTNPTGDLA